MNKAAYFIHPDAGYLRIEGADRTDFIQRQSTNDVTLLTPEQSVTTALTNPAARILDVLQLVSEPGEAIGAIPLPGRAAATVQFLKRHIFFMDKVTVTNVSDEYFQLDLEGQQTSEFLRAWGIKPPQMDGLVNGFIAGTPVRVVGQRGLAGMSYRLLAAAEDKHNLLAALDAAGASPLPPEDYEILRVQAGLPAASNELTEDYTPLEANLDEIVSETKGCYTGQEVLARQVAYDKITRRLVGLCLEAPVNVSWRVTVGGKTVGSVTSAIQSSQFGPIALAVVKRPHFQAGTKILVEEGADQVIGTISKLPFPI